MGTLVTFHAHPDDEASQTAGLMAKAASAGHRVVLITATDGALGEVHTELKPGQTLAERRHEEVKASAELLGAELIWLGYPDSGMDGDPSNGDPACFSQLDIEGLAVRVAAILTDVDADVLTVYDDHGGYGHPDHVQVHRVGVRAATIAGVEHVYEVTMNRDRMQEQMKLAAQLEGIDLPDPEFLKTLGTPNDDISYAVDARAFATTKQDALRAHDSQMPADNSFLTMPDEIFTEALGIEFYNVPGVSNTGGPVTVDLLPGLIDTDGTR